MPDIIGDEKVLKRSLEDNKKLILEAEQKIRKAVRQLKSDNPPKGGIGILYHLAGLFGQRLLPYKKGGYIMKRLTTRIMSLILMLSIVSSMGTTKISIYIKDSKRYAEQAYRESIR